jgi:uncharacterized protein (DUF433 family)
MIRVMNVRIQIHPEICHGKPVIRGTRVLVSVILGALAAGDSQEMILEDYPGLTKADRNCSGGILKQDAP